MIGFTGTQKGMTDKQAATFTNLLEQVFTESKSQGYIVTFRHGDCVGADEKAQGIARAMGIPTWAFRVPGPKCAYSKENYEVIEFNPGEHMVRNGWIVKGSLILFAVPDTMQEKQRSGTWATVRRARAKGIPVYIIWPDGEWEVDHDRSKAGQGTLA